MQRHLEALQPSGLAMGRHAISKREARHLEVEPGVGNDDAPEPLEATAAPRCKRSRHGPARFKPMVKPGR